MHLPPINAGMGKVILGLLGFVWGAAIIVYTFNSSVDSGSAYGMGQLAAGVVGLVLCVVGVRAVLNRAR